MHVLSFLLISLLLQSINQSVNALFDTKITESMIRPPREFSLPLTFQSEHPIDQSIDQSIHSNSHPINSPFMVELSRPTLKQKIDQSISQSTDQSRFQLNQYAESVAVLSGCSNVAFSAPVYINGQGPFKLIVDTGSTTLSVISTTCTNCFDQSISGLNTPSMAFNASGLTSVIDNGDVSVSYADGSSWSGAGYRGQVAVGNQPINQSINQSMAGGSYAVDMIFATIESHQGFVNVSQCGVYQSRKSWHQGIIGFAYETLGSKGTDAWFTNYAESISIANEFTIQMCVTPSGASSGNLWIGAFDHSYLASQFVYVPIVKEMHYNTYLNRITVDSQFRNPTTQSINRPINPGFTSADYGPCEDGINNNCAIVDSGTTYMSFPTNVRDRLIELIRADPGYQAYIPSGLDPLSARGCYRDNNYESFDVLNANLPTLSFSFAVNSKGTGSVTIVLEPMNGYLVISYDGAGNKYYCIGIGSTGEGGAILGYSFMNQFTIRHDIANRRMGFARTRQCGIAAPTMPNLAWNVSSWSVCGQSCGGWQWREITCVDVWGNMKNDIDCFNGFAGPKPNIGQPCGPQLCTFDNSTRVTSVSINPSINQLSAGMSVDLSFSFTGSPSTIQLYLRPINSVNQWPFIITKNASFSINQSITQHRWIVPTDLPVGQYVFGGFCQDANNEFLAPSAHSITVVAPVVPLSVIDQSINPCGSDGATGSPVCSNHGRCTVDQSTNQPICTCVGGFTGQFCNVSTIRGCSLQCLNEGRAGLSQTPSSSQSSFNQSINQECTCQCPHQFSGVLCEYRYVTITAVLSLDPSTVDGLSLGQNHAIFKRGLIDDLSFAAGFPSSDVSVNYVFPSGVRGLQTAVTFTLATPTNTAQLRQLYSDLSQLIDSQQSVPMISSLSAGLFSRYLTIMSAVNFPPNSFRLSDPTGDDVFVTITNHLTLIIGIVCGVMGGLMAICIGCLCVQRRELKKAMSSSAFKRRQSVVKRVEAVNLI